MNPKANPNAEHETGDDTPRNPATSLGDYLRRERELRGIALEDVRNVTRVQLEYLRRVEADEFDALPADVYARGYIRAYARFLGLDVEDCIERYEAHVPPADSALEAAVIIGAANARGDTTRVIEHAGSQTGQQAAANPSSPRRGLALVLVVLLLAVLAILFVYFTNGSSKQSAPNKAPSTTETATFDKPS